MTFLFWLREIEHVGFHCLTAASSDVTHDFPMLKLVGYWKGAFEAAEWPDPTELVDETWERPNRAYIVQYLRSGIRVHEDMGFSHCRFESGPSQRDIGNAELTDGTWIWPEGLWVYVETFSVRLPDEFIAHMRAKRFEVPSDLDSEALEIAPVDLAFWRKWCTERDLR